MILDYEYKKELGQVFTSKKEVEDMFALLKDINYSSKFLEPGCGSGNFLIEILDKKIKSILKLPEIKASIKSNNKDDFEYKLIICITSVYGVDIDDDVINIARRRCCKVIEENYKKILSVDEVPTTLLECIKFILNKNIILGDLVNSPEKINIYEYSEVEGLRIKVRKFKFNDLIFPEDEVFGDFNKLFTHIPIAKKEYDPVLFRDLRNIDG